MAFTKADQAREIGFAWLNGVEARQRDCNTYSIDNPLAAHRSRASFLATRDGYPSGTSMHAAFVAGYASESTPTETAVWPQPSTEGEPDDEGLTEEERDEVLRNDPNWINNQS